MIQELWNKLDATQRKLVAGAAVFVCIALILELAVFPFWEAKKKLDRSISSNQKKLAEVKELSAEFNRLESKVSAMRRVASMRAANFTLFSHLEKKATQAGVRNRIKNMNSSRGIQSASFEESLIDMKLEKVTIKQLVDFLYYAESPADLVRVKKIHIVKMKDAPEYLSVQLQISSISRRIKFRKAGNHENTEKQDILVYDLRDIHHAGLSVSALSLGYRPKQAGRIHCLLRFDFENRLIKTVPALGSENEKCPSGFRVLPKYLFSGRFPRRTVSPVEFFPG